MCTSITVNRNKTLVGWNLDILGMEYRVSPSEEAVLIEIYDAKEGWLPLFGANSRGDFVGMPTCHPFDGSGNPPFSDSKITMMLNIDLLLQKRSFEEIKAIAEKEMIYNIPNVNFMSSISNRNGDVLHIIPGQGYKYYKKPDHIVLTNFSPFKGESLKHPWIGLDRYKTAESILSSSNGNFEVEDMFFLLKECSQEECPTVVSMVFDVTDMTVYWCENRNFNQINKKQL
ncbi:MAG: hypothetical protein Q4B60_07010 [Erysipelotrichaceae bacterium]|nr:hypothetical protein [Erysipelotrichaceae bacterium]